MKWQSFLPSCPAGCFSPSCRGGRGVSSQEPVGRAARLRVGHEVPTRSGGLALPPWGTVDGCLMSGKGGCPSRATLRSMVGGFAFFGTLVVHRCGTRIKVLKDKERIGRIGAKKIVFSSTDSMTYENDPRPKPPCPPPKKRGF